MLACFRDGGRGAGCIERNRQDWLTVELWDRREE
jgi:hypothetical protein